MFEDATFESTGKIRTRSRGWMVATFGLDTFILIALILIPLIYPEAISRHAMAVLLTAPPAVPDPTPSKPTPQRAFQGRPQIDDGRLIMPTLIPTVIRRFSGTEGASPSDFAVWEGIGESSNQAANPVFHAQRPSVSVEKKGPVRISSMVVAGMILHKTVPSYPPIAIATRTEGTVILQATISKAGSIENLRSISGPAMLQQAAMDAVSHWKYRPFLLNGEPVEVETTVNVIFALGH